MSRFALLANVRPFFAPDTGAGSGGGDGGADIPVDDLSEDIAAAWDEVAGAGDGGDSERLGDSGATEGTQRARGARDGEQTQTEDRGDGRSRDGRFAGKDRGAPRAQSQQVPDRKDAAATPPADQLAGGPPTSFAPASKVAWNAFKQAFPQIAADIAKRESEVGEGLAALRDYKDLAPYAQMAKESGTTLSQALLRYTNLETVARRNPVQGLIAMCAGLQLAQPDAASVLLRAAQLLGAKTAAADRNAAAQPNGGADRNAEDPFLQAVRPIMTPIIERMVKLEESLNGFSRADRNAREQTLDSAITAFANDEKNVFFPDVEETITRLFETGMVPLTGNHSADLAKAYDIAVRMDPKVSEALIEQRLGQRGQQTRGREQEIADRARRASRSLAGSQATDVERNTSERKKQREFAPGQKPTDDIMGDVEAAYEQVAGNVSY